MKALLSLLVFLVLALGPAESATLDFGGFRKGPTPGPLEFPDVATVQSAEGALFVYGSGDFGIPGTGGVCALRPDFSCTGDLSLLFIGPVSNLSFRGYFAQSSDTALITAYAGDQRLATQLVSGNDSEVIDVDFGGISGITRLEVTDLSTGISRGMAYGDFNFGNDPPGTPLPRLPEKFLTFDSAAKGMNGPVVDVDGATISGRDGGRVFVYHTGDFSMPQNGGVCAVLSDFSCMGDLLIEFDTPVFDLMFSGFYALKTDSVFISIFNGSVLVFSGTFGGTSGGTILFDFRSVGVLTSLLIEDRSDPDTNGMAFGDFRYTTYVPTPVPLPASVVSLLAALTGLLLVRRRGRTEIRTA